MVTNTGYITTEDGPRLFFEKAGSGAQTVVVLNAHYLFEDFKYLAEDCTLIGLDLRNRGRSDYVTDRSKLHGIQQDVEDVEAARRHFGIDRIDLIAHSYVGMIAALYAMKYPEHAGRVVLIGAVQPNSTTKYPPELTNQDAVLFTFFNKVQELEKERATTDPKVFGRKFWSLLRPIYVANPDHVDRILHWDCCDLETELNLMPYWLGTIQPSLQAVQLTAGDLAVAKAPFLIVHGTKDRSGPYGGAKDWVRMLPNARLLTVEDVAHAPWIEAPEQVLPAIRAFLIESAAS